ncbi:DUF2946 domain-containing protein [Acinetobacter chinensis]|uniref:DUF2946 domain-containing protein n=1 Tax=Acinetobacter chinensis TaxID=2004650 RepID=A0A3B7LRL6_9GAMM|nr:DUF2946 family protein [Acinetobacter chinensis]AXY55432.1 DUF2946 domain-containing protein [Acinetobacter chinensis]
MLLRSGLLLSFAAVFLQIAVFLQPLLPKQYQVAPVCETITRALLLKPDSHSSVSHSHHAAHSAVSSTRDHADLSVQHESEAASEHHHHDAGHQCQYCTVYGNLVLPPELEVKEVLDRIQVRLLAFQKTFSHVWFVLQRLFLLPQGRAPPLSA